METAIVSLIIVSGFSLISLLYIRHIAKLELLIKAENLADYTYSQKLEETPTKLEDTFSEDIQEVFSNHSNAEVIEAFKNGN